MCNMSVAARYTPSPTAIADPTWTMRPTTVAVSTTCPAPVATSQAAPAVNAAAEPDLKPGKNFCTGDPEAVTITITLRTTAHTFALGRLDFTKHYTNITQTETAGESAV